MDVHCYLLCMCPMYLCMMIMGTLHPRTYVHSSHQSMLHVWSPLTLPPVIQVQLSLQAAPAHGGAGPLLPAPLPAHGHTPTHLLTYCTIKIVPRFTHKHWYSPIKQLFYTRFMYSYISKIFSCSSTIYWAHCKTHSLLYNVITNYYEFSALQWQQRTLVPCDRDHLIHVTAIYCN